MNMMNVVNKAAPAADDVWIPFELLPLLRHMFDSRPPRRWCGRKN